MRRRIKDISLLIFGLIILAGLFAQPARAQENPYYYDYPYNNIKWYTIQSPHFLIHFQKGNSRSAQVVSRVAEEVYGPLTSLYHHKPDSRISIVLHDREDYSNGASYFFDNMIDIWVPALDMPLRGTHNWFRNVISHEFTHMVQIQAAMKRSRHVPAIYFQWLSYENVRRPDVLYGYPNGVITLPFASVSVPAWLAEGTAQFQREGLHYDFWDSQRDMIIRTRALDGSLLSLTKMGTFSSKTSIEREVVYNQGFGFTRYLAYRFGEDVLYKITHALSENGVNDISKAIKDATGIDGYMVYDQWVDSLRSEYKEGTSDLRFSKSDTLEKKGFYNLAPQFSPDGGQLAYLSNKGRDTYEVSLYLKNFSDSSSAALIPDALKLRETRDNTDTYGFPIVPKIKPDAAKFSFSPDGKEIAYSQHTNNPYGEYYQDIFIYNLDTKKDHRLTHSARISEPNWSPDGKLLVAVQQHDATLNLVTLDTKTDSIQTLLKYNDGEQLYHPVWSKDGASIFYAASNLGSRGIYRYDMKTGEATPLLVNDSIDYRGPSVGPDGKYLYYSSNPDDIFNIYRMNIKTGKTEQITSVLGGAFEPTVNDKGQLAYSEYMADGFKISLAKIPDDDPTLGTYHKPSFSKVKTLKNADYVGLNHFDDRDLQTFNKSVIAEADTGSYKFDISTRGETNQRSLYSYHDTFTSFSFFPVVRFDNYARPEGPNGKLITHGHLGRLGQNLWRDTKVGFYMASHDVLNRFSLYGGALFGLGSVNASGIGDFISPARLIDLDRDLFLIAEYRGLPFIKKRWSPTASIELYSLRRNVKNGLSIQEFPSVSQLPDTTKVDIAYDIWEADFYLRSKIDKWNMVELGATYSPYTVTTKSFYSKEYRQYLSSSSSQYFIGSGLTAAYIFDLEQPYRNDDIAPLGIRGELRYRYQPSKLLSNYDIKDGILSPNYLTYNNQSVEAKIRFGFKALGETMDLNTRFFTYFNNPGDYFFQDYIGGFPGMRSYPYFALGGNTTAYATLAYNVPLLTGINKQVGRYTIDKIYGRFFMETGNGWRGPLDIGNNLKTGIGAELRVSMNSSYLFPTRFFISGAYGLNKFNVNLPDGFITNTGINKVTYGRHMLFYFGLLFDFDM